MHTITQAAMPLKLIGAILALTLIAALAITLSGGASAQSPDNIYADPQPCGPGAQTAFMEEPHEVTTGHFALFDAYWENTTVPTDDPVESGGLGNTGILHTNECPPLVSRSTEVDPNTGTSTTVTTLTASGIDTDEAIFHVLDNRETTVVGDAADDTEVPQISTVEYVQLRDYADAGDRVWWLRLDDPDTEADESSDLKLGFSTMRFSDHYWKAPDDVGGPAFQYHFELERHPGIPASEHPHFLAYKAPEMNGRPALLVWDSARADTQALAMNPGEVTDLQWIFTQPGTYEITVHLRGYVRATEPDDVEGWEPISDNQVETSEVKRYVFQVGTALDETEPPSFGVSYTIDTAPAAGDSVGAPIRVIGAETPSLTYTLSGDGHEHFTVVSLSDPDRAQIVVGDAAALNPVQQKSYDLTIGVTDGVDHEGNVDDTIDHTLAVNIELTYPWMTLTVDDPHPHLFKTVVLTAHLVNFGTPDRVAYHFTDEHGRNLLTTGRHFPIARGQTSTERFFVHATYLPEGGDPDADTQRLDAVNSVTISWR